jgi:hypothetical protein
VSPGEKLPIVETDGTTSNTDVKKTWIYTSSLPYAYMAY